MSFEKPEHLHAGDIAVIGLACRFPGGASNESKFWDLLHGRKSAYSEVPSERYNINAFHHPGGDKINTLSTRGGHFLDEDVAAFDAPFFQITAQEARAMDPTARMLLEVAYEALENAGLPIESLVGSDTSCYVGCFTRDYHEMLMRDAETAPMYAGTGTGFSLISNRLSWFYDFKGPSLTLDTACSSSLVALHLACQGLRSGESKIAVVSGANLILGPDLALWLSNLHMLSSSGLSKSFSEGANGYGRGEGIATVILKPLADALRDGDTVRSIIRGTGVNQDGHTTGITLPNSDAQADLIRSTYRAAGLDYSQTPYFEAHGTGTAAGDPLELAAVAKTVSHGRQPRNELHVGSVKSNIGHLEGAAGLAGLIKCILMLENDVILPNIHFDKPNPRIPFDLWKIRVPTTVLPWPADSIRRVSVNSFGYGGTNAHAILDSAGNLQSKQSSSKINGDSAHLSKLDYPDRICSEKQRLFVFSAHDEPAHHRVREQFKNYLDSQQAQSSKSLRLDDAQFLDNLSFTLGERRSRLNWKSFVVASTVEALKTSISNSSFKPTRSPGTPRIAFIFTGQGAQWAQMGIQLMRYPTFRNSIEAADIYLRDVLSCEWSVFEELSRGAKDSRIQLAKFSQPLCTILQVALVDLMETWGIEPTGVVGHSSGEIAAAYCYGAISLEVAWQTSYWRGKLCSDLSTGAPHLRGAMIAVGLSDEAARGYIKQISDGEIVVACINSPLSVTISGDESGIDELETLLKADSVFCRKLKVENAYHSHHMEYIAKIYLEKLSNIQASVPAKGKKIKMVSSVTQGVVKYTDLGPAYWVQNMVSPVLFSQAVKTLMQDTTGRRRRLRKGETDFDLMIEIGPHAALKGPLRQILEEGDIQNVIYRQVLMRGEDATTTCLNTLGALYLQGVNFDTAKVNLTQNDRRTLTDLPSYPFNHSLTYWCESRISKTYRFREHGRHDLLGAPAHDFNPLEPKWRHFLRPSENPWIRDHVIQGSIIYPGAGTIALVLEAMEQMSDKTRHVKNFELQNVRIDKAIVVPDDQFGVEVILQMRRQRNGSSGKETGWWEFSVYSCLEDQELEENAFGQVTVEYHSEQAQSWSNKGALLFNTTKKSFQKVKEICTQQILPQDFYEATSSAGLIYGPSFQGITAISAGRDHCYCTIAIPDTKCLMPGGIESPHLIHPTTLDIIFHSMFAALGDGELELENAAVPVSFDSIIISGSLPSGANAQFTGFCHTKKDAHGDLIADIHMSDPSWDEAKVQVMGIRCKKLPKEAAKAPLAAPFGTLLWKPDIDTLDATTLWSYITSNSSILPVVETLSSNGNPVTNGVKSNKAVQSICNLIDLAAHKDPNISILQVGTGSKMLVSSLLSVLGAGPTDTSRFATYTITESSKVDLESSSKLLQEWSSTLNFSLLDLTADLQNQGVQADSVDVLIIANDFSKIEDQHIALQDIRNLLKEEGKLLIISSAHDEGLSEATIGSGLIPFVVPKTMLDEYDELPFIATKTISKEERVSEKVYVLRHSNQGTDQSGIELQLTSALSQVGLQPQTLIWPATNLNDLKSARVISLLEFCQPFLSEISPSDFEILQGISTQCSNMLWVSSGEDPAMHAAIGYLRSLRNENPTLSLRYLLLEGQDSRSVEDIANKIVRVALATNSDSEFVEKDGILCINRWVADESMSTVIAKDTASSGRGKMALGESIKSLMLVHGTSEISNAPIFTVHEGAGNLPGDHEVVIEVKAFLLSSKQQVEAAAKAYSGIVTKTGRNVSRLNIGDRICVACPGPYRSSIIVQERLCLPIPENISFAEATSWPIAYLSVYQAIVRVARVISGRSVLVQDAASAVGLLAVQLSLQHGAKVFAIVQSEVQSLLVQGLGVPNTQVLSEGDLNIAATIAILSQGKGMNVVLSTSTTGEALNQLWKSTAPSGVFVDVGTASGSESSTLDIAPFRRGATFSIIDIDLMLQEKSELVAEVLLDVSRSLQQTPIKQVTPHLVFPASNVSSAFAALAEANEGSVILTLSPGDQISVSPQAQNQLSLDGSSTYMIVGGLGGLGRSLAQLLVSNGARNIVTVSRSGVASPAAQALVQQLTERGIVVKNFACDVSNEAEMTKVIEQCTAELPPIRGVIQSAAVLRDAIYENMSHTQWSAAISPKIQGSWLLHQLLPPTMDFFVMLSSISGVVGNRSQANYAAGNTFQDALAHYRAKLGLAAVSVDLGLMVGIGLIAERGGATNLQRSEAVGINEVEFHALMKAVLAGSFVGKRVPTQLICGLPTGGILQAANLEAPFYFSDPRFSLLKTKDVTFSSADPNSTSSISANTNSLPSQLSLASSLDEASSLISVALSGKIARGLQTTVENIDNSKPLHSYGIDSLMAVEIRSWVVLNAKSEISLFDLLSGVSISGLAAKIAKRSKLLPQTLE